MSLPKPATVLHAQKLGTDIVNTNHSAILLNFPKSFITCPTIAEFTVDLPSQHARQSQRHSPSFLILTAPDCRNKKAACLYVRKLVCNTVENVTYWSSCTSRMFDEFGILSGNLYFSHN